MRGAFVLPASQCVTGSFALATEDGLSRFRFAHIVPDSQSFVKHFSVALKRYMVVTSRSGCHVSRLTCLDCTKLLSDCQALFCGVVRLPSRLSPVYHSVLHLSSTFFCGPWSGLLPSPSLARPLYHSRAHLSTLFSRKFLWPCVYII